MKNLLRTWMGVGSIATGHWTISMNMEEWKICLQLQRTKNRKNCSNYLSSFNSKPFSIIQSCSSQRFLQVGMSWDWEDMKLLQELFQLSLGTQYPTLSMGLRSEKGRISTNRCQILTSIFCRKTLIGIEQAHTHILGTNSSSELLDLPRMCPSPWLWSPQHLPRKLMKSSKISKKGQRWKK